MPIWNEELQQWEYLYHEEVFECDWLGIRRDMDQRFEFLPLNEQGREVNNELREKLSDVCKMIESVPNSRERSLALTKIEEAAMWFTKGLVRTDGYKDTSHK